jgi:hypothetical protein
MAPAPVHKDRAAAAPGAQAGQSAVPKQYFHFVVDGVSYKSGDEMGKVKRIEIEYKGDGLVPDLVKTVMALSSGGESATAAEGAGIGKLIGAQSASAPCLPSAPARVSDWSPATSSAPELPSGAEKKSRKKSKSESKAQDSH